MEITLALAALKLVGYGLSTIGPGLGIGIACYGCCVATARQPELQGHELHHRCCSRRGSGPHRLRAYLHRVIKPHSDTVPYKAYIGGNVRES